MSEIEDLILELLSIAPSSFAALFGLLVRETTGNRPTVTDVFAVATHFEARGWLDAPQADMGVGALSYDEIGLWFELLPDGRRELHRRNVPGATEPAWMLDFDSAHQTLTVRATDEQTAENAVEQWLRVNPAFGTAEGRELARTSPFRLRNGTTVNEGVLLRVRLIKRRA